MEEKKNFKVENWVSLGFLLAICILCALFQDLFSKYYQKGNDISIEISESTFDNISLGSIEITDGYYSFSDNTLVIKNEFLDDFPTGTYNLEIKNGEKTEKEVIRLINYSTAKKRIAILSNCFVIPGIIYICVGLLTLVSTTGFFDIFGYGFRSLWVLFTPSKKAMEQRINYREYKDRKEEKGRNWKPFLLYSGTVSLAIGIIFNVIFSCIN